MQTETLRISPKLHKAVVHLQALPEVQQEQIVKQIEDFYQVLSIIKVTRQSDSDKNTNGIDETKQANSQNLDVFERWQKWHDEHKEFLDDDTSWADVRNKNDFGREPVN